MAIINAADLGPGSPLDALAQQASVEACQPEMPDWQIDALMNRVLNDVGPLGFTAQDVLGVVYGLGRSIDHMYEYSVGLL
jgi:hypothetical protein